MIENGRYDQIPKVNRFCPTRGYNRRWNSLNYSTALNMQVLRTLQEKRVSTTEYQTMTSYTSQ